MARSSLHLSLHTSPPPRMRVAHGLWWGNGGGTERNISPAAHRSNSSIHTWAIRSLVISIPLSAWKSITLTHLPGSQACWGQAYIPTSEWGDCVLPCSHCERWAKSLALHLMSFCDNPDVRFSLNPILANLHVGLTWLGTYNAGHGHREPKHQVEVMFSSNSRTPLT